jgi:hypothetical protein
MSFLVSGWRGQDLEEPEVQVRLEENQWRFADPSSQASPGLFQADIVRSFMGKSVLLPCNTYIS